MKGVFVMKNKTAAVLSLILAVLTALVGPALAAAPEPPATDILFDSQTEAEFNELAVISGNEAFERLKHEKYFTDEKRMSKAAFKAYENRRKEAFDIAEKNLRLPVRYIVDGNVVTRTPDFYVSKKILEAFPDEGLPMLNRLFRDPDATTRGNVVRASGNMPGPAATSILMEALADKTPLEDVQEIEGEPMRVCDMAYNQLVLRYRIKDVLRTIGTIYPIEERDYHIGILKEIISEGE
jgi:hypothetical protein